MSMTLPLQRLLDEPLPPTLKGLPRRAVGQPLSALNGLGLSVLVDLPLPVAVLKSEAMDHNSTWMRGFVQRAGASLCPHGKTTMAPQLFERQLNDGAWGITAATASHLRTYRQFGVRRILLANQLVGAANIDIVFDEIEADPEVDIYVLVDSHAAMDELKAALIRRPLPRPLQVLLEVGAMRGRTGVRTTEEGLALGRALRDASPGLALRGIEAFEGIFGGDDSHRIELSVFGMMDVIAALAKAGCNEGWFAPGEVLLTAGGSQFFDIAARVLAAVQPRERFHVVLRSGCYLSHDTLHYGRMAERMRERAGPLLWGSGKPLRNALEVWALVQSVPEPGRAICNLGKRDISADLMLPQPVVWYRQGTHEAPVPVPTGLKVVGLNDQHAYVDAAPGTAMPWQVGDLVGFGVGHPCTTFDKWPLLYVADASYRVVGGVRTFF